MVPTMLCHFDSRTSTHHFELILEIVLFFEKKVQVRNKGERNQVI